MAGDHGNIHIINNVAAWDAKLAEAKSTGKVVSVTVPTSAPFLLIYFQFRSIITLLYVLQYI